MIEEMFLHGHARRDGAVVCERVLATIRSDGFRRHVSVRFLAGVDRGLREELERLLHARGIRGAQVAERLAPVDLELHHPRGERRLTGCRLGPPIRRFAPLEDIDFRVLGQEPQGTR